jgi:trehalose 6-phosphate phosphatase
VKHLLEREGRQALAALMRARPLLAFDFDGTLAPIVARPDDARVSAAVSQRLARLAQLCPVAIVTGRSVADVEPRLGFVPHYIVGNHGAEDPERGEGGAEASAFDALRARIAAQADDLQRAGIRIEDKQYSLALHYRLAKDRDQALARIEHLLAGLDRRLATFGGKCVVNVVVAGAPDKGDAVVALVERCGAGAALFVGDDVNDEAVFARAAPNWLTVRIGRDDPTSRAAYFLDSHAEVATLLEAMLALLEGDAGAWR